MSITTYISLGSQDIDTETSEVDDLAVHSTTVLTQMSVCKKSPIPAAAPVAATASAKKKELLSTTKPASVFVGLSMHALRPFFDY